MKEILDRVISTDSEDILKKLMKNLDLNSVDQLINELIKDIFCDTIYLPSSIQITSNYIEKITPHINALKQTFSNTRVEAE